MSAGSKTNPGGYVVEPESLEQFSISDERTPSAIADIIRSKVVTNLFGKIGREHSQNLKRATV